MRSALASLAVICFATVLSVLVLDVTLRFFGIRPVNLRPALHQESVIPGLEYELRSHLRTHGFRSEIVTTNSRGFRSPEVVKGKPVIAILGDSYAFGFGVRDEETNPAVIGEMLPEYNIVNTGVNGYNIEQEARTYEAKIRALRPVVTVLEFTPNDGDRKAYFDRDIRERVAATSTGWTVRGPRWWMRTSPLVDIVLRGLKRMQEPLPSHVPFTVEWGESALRMYRTWFERLSVGMETEERLLVLWPDRARRESTFRSIRAMGEQQGWHVLDLTPLLGNEFDRLGWDAHPSAKTQRIAGEAIAETLKTILDNEEG